MENTLENSADYEMAELEAVGNRSAELKKRGICTHGWWTSIPVVKCLHCGKEFKTDDDLWDEGQERLGR